MENYLFTISRWTLIYLHT